MDVRCGRSFLLSLSISAPRVETHQLTVQSVRAAHNMLRPPHAIKIVHMQRCVSCAAANWCRIHPHAQFVAQWRTSASDSWQIPYSARKTSAGQLPLALLDSWMKFLTRRTYFYSLPSSSADNSSNKPFLFRLVLKLLVAPSTRYLKFFLLNFLIFSGSKDNIFATSIIYQFLAV